MTQPNEPTTTSLPIELVVDGPGTRAGQTFLEWAASEGGWSLPDELLFKITPFILAIEAEAKQQLLSDPKTVAALAALCRDCDGNGYTIGALPLPSGEPGEPFQIQCLHGPVGDALAALRESVK